MNKTVNSTIRPTRSEWLKIHTLTPEQRNLMIAQKLERALKQFRTPVKAPELT